jgi:multidrug transporter EmrE-like cation transporter
MLKYVLLALIMLDVALNVTGQLSLKYGMSRIGNFSLSMNNLPPVFLKAAFNPFVLLGLLCYGLGFMVWLLVLAKAEVSWAYPLISLGYVFTALLARPLCGEAVTLSRMTGIIIICAGVFLVARS